ncbi:hypothetical protein HUJ04_011830 [Dendroctonus ponderosae]|nr:hypothetical protein HUJ04_011830 [Dendroctonus ponderosae]
MYIGLECGLTNNVWLAEKFFQQAQVIAPEDPFILHERGVICFQNEEQSEQFFVEALDKIKRVRRGPIPSRWATLWNNLGHARRKLKKLDEALECHNEMTKPASGASTGELDTIHERYMTCLRVYTQHMYPQQATRFQDLLVRLPEIQSAASLLLENGKKLPDICML